MDFSISLDYDQANLNGFINYILISLIIAEKMNQPVR
jgi:hypothetical protein